MVGYAAACFVIRIWELAFMERLQFFLKCIGTMNPPQPLPGGELPQRGQQGAADVSSAELLSDCSAGNMPGI